MDLGLTDKVVVITGASSGIGLATAKLFAQEGAHVVMMARRTDVLETARDAVASIGSAESIALDVTDLDRFQSALTDIADRHDRLDVMVNNAGSGTFAPIDGMELADFQEGYRLHADVPFVSMRCIFPIMEKQGGGAIVNISSITSVRAQESAAAHSSCRAALNQLSAVAAVEGAPKGIRVNTLQVGSVATEASQEYLQAYPEMARKVTEANPMKRWATPEEIAACIVFLASDRASFVSGALMAVDGALSVKFPY